MAAFYGYKELTKIDDWPDIVGRKNWQPKASAYELGHCWHEAAGLPIPIATAIEASGCQVFRGLSVDVCLVEKPVFLDTRIAPSMTDLMAYGRNRNDDKIVIAVLCGEVTGSEVSYLAG